MSNQRRAVTAAMTEGLSSQPPRISINNSTFTLIDRAGNEMMCNLVDPQLGRYLDVIIAGANNNKSKIFYDGDWTPQSSEPPLCWSDNGIAPSVNAMTPQHPTCNGCEWNKIGSETSKLTGRGIKACQDRKKLGVFVVGLSLDDLYQFQVTPAALKNLSAYGKWVSGQPSRSGNGAADVSEVITRLYFVQGQQGVIGFAAVAAIDEAQDAAIDRAWNSGKIPEIIGTDDKPISGLLAAPAQQAQLPPPQQQWAPPPAQLPAPAGANPHAQPPQQFQQPVHQPQQFTAAQPVAPANYPAPPPDQLHNDVPGFLQRAQQPAPQPAQQFTQQQTTPEQPTQPGFTSPAPGGKGKGRGGARPGAGRRSANGPADPNASQQHAGPAPTQQGAAFGAPQGQQPGFVQQHQQPAQPAQAFGNPNGAQPQGQPAPQYGMAPAGAPPPDMSAALDRAFSMPLPPVRQ